MKPTFAAALLVSLAACSKEAPLVSDPAQRALIWDSVKAYHEAADKSDLSTIKTLLAPEVSIATSHETLERGDEAVAKVLQDRLKVIEGQSRSTLLGKEYVSLVGDLGYVTYIANVGTQRGLITAVLRKNKDGKWLLVHLHDTWTEPPPPVKK